MLNRTLGYSCDFLSLDKDIHVTIVAESDGFLINYDGQRFCYKFRHRMPLETIRSIRTDNGFVKVGYVSCVLKSPLGCVQSGVLAMLVII
jgi:hypothetical protein